MSVLLSAINHTGWWYTPLKNISQIGSSSQLLGKKCSNPPTSNKLLVILSAIDKNIHIVVN